MQCGLVEQKDLGARGSSGFEGEAAQLAAAERLGALVELGHTLFAFRNTVMRDPATAGLGTDVDLDSLGASAPALATFVPRLGSWAGAEGRVRTGAVGP